MKLTAIQVNFLSDFVTSIGISHKFTREQYDHSYQQWIHGGVGWDCAQQGGTGIMRMLMWYHHVFAPGSKEWRPKTIIEAILKEMETAK